MLQGANEVANKYNEAIKSKLKEEEIAIYFKVLNTILSEQKNIELLMGEKQ